LRGTLTLVGVADLGEWWDGVRELISPPGSVSGRGSGSKSARHAQRFLSAFSGISFHFRPRRHLLRATQWRTEMTDRFAAWDEVTALDAAA